MTLPFKEKSDSAVDGWVVCADDWGLMCPAHSISPPN